MGAMDGTRFALGSAVGGAIMAAAAAAAGAAPAERDAALFEQGQRLAARHHCAACHGPGLDQPSDGAVPRLAGQNEAYLLHAMAAYLPGADGGPRERNNRLMMLALVTEDVPARRERPMTEGELRALAHYIAALPAAPNKAPR